MTTPTYVDLDTVHNPTSGTSPTVAWGDDIRSNFELLSKMPGCIAQRTATQALTTATVTAIALTASDLRDTDAFHDTTTNNTRCTVPTGLGGLYTVVGSVQFAGNTTGERLIQLRVNGLTTYNSVNSQATNPATTGVLALQVTDDIVMVAGDYVELLAYQNSGGNLNVTPCKLSMRMVAVS